jgi:exopolysaccharide biosynthesis polyprenyl glycosylphosphotransferase
VQQPVLTPFADHHAASDQVLVVERASQSRSQGHATVRRSVVAGAILLDAVLLGLAFWSAYVLRYILRWVPVERSTTSVDLQDWLPFGLVFTLTVLISLVMSGVYRAKLGREILDELLMTIRATLVAVGVLVIVSVFLPIGQYSRLLVVYAWLLASAYVVIGKIMAYALLSRLRGGRLTMRRVLVVGSTPLSKMVMQHLLTRRRQGYQLVGFVHEGPVGTAQYARSQDFGRLRCLGRVEDLDTVIPTLQVDEVIIALPAAQHDRIAQVCAYCEQSQVAVKLVPDLFEMRLSKVSLDNLAGIPLIDVRRGDLSRGALHVKRGIDLVVAGLGLVICAPLFLLTALAIKIDSPGPVFISQQRIGKGGRPFAFYKFRSMRRDADKQREMLLAQQGIVSSRIFKDRRDPRRTRVGRVIRQLSIDELPQLFNVLRGDMSLVGPRPPLPDEVAQYEPHHFKRLEVIGGITGMWQVSGRSTIESFEEITMLDTYYIDNWSLALDLKILLRTILAVLARTGAY